MSARALLWFRNDLRMHDNQLFHFPQVLHASEVIAVYCLDPRHFSKSPWGDHSRLGPHRGRFLSETIESLAKSLANIDCNMLVVSGRPEDVIPSLLGSNDILAFQQEDTTEEQEVEEAVLGRIPDDTVVLRHYGQTLYHRDDLGWDVKSTFPIPFGKFKFGCTDKIQVRAELPPPARGSLPPSPTLERLLSKQSFCRNWTVVQARVNAIEAVMSCDPAPSTDPDQVPAIAWQGGEASALARLASYATPGGLGTYHRTRNQLHGANNSSHLSPWMANGSLSPRTIYWRVIEFEKTQIKGKDGLDHVYKFIFELCWRDYFRLYCAHFGARVFWAYGPAGLQRQWMRDAEAETRWKQGQTGVPLIDALMRELLLTGYMANRGRYIVASYLVHFLGLDWRVGADWFERLLLDHDVCSNYGEWASMAGVAAAPTKDKPLGLKGRGPSKGKSSGFNGTGGNPWAKAADAGEFVVFDPWEQGKQYDRSEVFVRRWVLELRHVPVGQAHWPHNLSREAWLASGCGDYPGPLATCPFKFSNRLQQSPRLSNVPRSLESTVVRKPKVVLQSREQCENECASAGTARSGRRWRAKTPANSP